MPLLSLRLWVSYFPLTRVHVILLGPCFKTGEADNLPLHHDYQLFTHRGHQAHTTRRGHLLRVALTFAYTQHHERQNGLVDTGTRRVLYTRAITLSRNQATFPSMTDQPNYRSWCYANTIAQDYNAHQPQGKKSHTTSKIAAKHKCINTHSALPRCTWSVSRTIELSLQSSFQLSLMVLVYYRTRVVFSLGWSLPPDLSCILKQPDSRNNTWTIRNVRTGLTPSMDN